MANRTYGVSWSVGSKRLKENTKTDLPSSRTPSCNANPDFSEAVVQCGIVLLSLVLLVLYDL